MKILVVSGSRADQGLLEWPVRMMKNDPFFEVDYIEIWNQGFERAFTNTGRMLSSGYDFILLLGDRFEILAAAVAAHLKRVPIAHIAGGDVTEGSYDDAMRDCITRLATIHFVTSEQSFMRLKDYQNVFLVGNPGMDYILHANWKKPRPIEEPYVVVSYQAETIDSTIEIVPLLESLPKDKRAVFMMPNPDAGSEQIRNAIITWKCTAIGVKVDVYEYLQRDDFLNLIYHCDEFIGNSSSMFYEAPFLGINTRIIGKRQKGRVVPLGDGKASERIIQGFKAYENNRQRRTRESH